MIDRAIFFCYDNNDKHHRERRWTTVGKALYPFRQSTRVRSNFFNGEVSVFIPLNSNSVAETDEEIARRKTLAAQCAWGMLRQRGRLINTSEIDFFDPKSYQVKLGRITPTLTFDSMKPKPKVKKQEPVPAQTAPTPVHIRKSRNRSNNDGTQLHISF
ncbi:MAG: hypothetical protein NTW79_03795 [Candidatus Berkelbacteria bacterium]|nr:hypothetical protein [Candidatus Berkelbacteria bacterium]